MPRKALSRSTLVVTLGLLAAAGRSAVGQAPVGGQAPSGGPSPSSVFSGFNTAGFNTAGSVGGVPPTTMPGTGNPFLRRGFPRATLMAPGSGQPAQFDPALTPVAFEAPLGSQPVTGQPSASATLPTGPSNVASPATSVLPNYADQPATGVPPGVFTPESPVPMPNGAVAQAEFAAPQSPPQPAPQPPTQPNLQGVALLRSIAQIPPGSQHPLVPVLQWCEGALAQMDGLADYTCTFKKREFVDGKMSEQCSMYVKSRPRPLSVYMHFLAPRDVHGQEAIYVEGRNEGRLLAHPVGIKKTLVGTVSLLPTDPQAMEGNRHPISDFGLRRLCERYRDGLRDDLQFGECDLRILDNVVVEGRPCVCIQITHPVPRQEFKFNVTRLFVDAEWNVPCRFEAYAWASRPGEQPLLVEEYTYANLKLNVGLTEADFDVRNPQYRF